MKLENSCIHSGEKILSQPWNQDHQGTETGCKKGQQKRPPVMQHPLQQPVIVIPELVEAGLETMLHPDQGIAALLCLFPCLLIP